MAQHPVLAAFCHRMYPVLPVVPGTVDATSRGTTSAELSWWCWPCFRGIEQNPLHHLAHQKQQKYKKTIMSILEYNGAAIIAMAGKDCVGIAADRRLGIQLQTVSTNFTKVFQMQPKLFVGLAGLATDVQTLRNLLEYRLNFYKLKEEREMSPQVFSHMLAKILYSKRFAPYFVEPVVAGLDENGKPFLSCMDLIGAGIQEETFVVSGTCTGNM